MSDVTITIPDALARDVAGVYGADGVAWLKRLPELLADCARRWSLTLGPPFSGGYVNYVAPATDAAGAELVLKVGVPHKDRNDQLFALRLYNGQGAVRLLESDPEGGVMLLERIRPGTQLAELSDDDEATRIAAQVMRRLWRPVPTDHPLPTVAEWARGLDALRQRYEGGTGPIPSALVERAEGLFCDLLASSDKATLLHGDLHHYNILKGEREPWLAIDPAGVVGEAGFEVGPFLNNPEWVFTAPDLDRILSRRMDILAETLGMDREGLHGWSNAWAVLSAWWCIEGNSEHVENSIAFAGVLADAV